MNNEDDIMTIFLRFIGAALIFHLIIAIGLLCSSCTTTKVVERVNTEYIHTADTLLRWDSVYVHTADTLILGGDTVTRIAWRWRDKVSTEYKLRHDTILKQDSIPVAVAVKAEPTWWERVKLTLFYPLIVFVILCISVIYVQRHDS